MFSPIGNAPPHTPSSLQNRPEVPVTNGATGSPSRTPSGVLSNLPTTRPPSPRTAPHDDNSMEGLTSSHSRPVSAQTKQLLSDSQAVINKIKQDLLPFGAGNQKADIARTDGQSLARTQAAQAVNPFINSFPRLGPLRASSVLMKAGNCQEQAAVAHGLLREKLSADYVAAFASRTLPGASGPDHHFAVVWHKDNPDVKVAVDPWTIKAQAVLLDDHFSKNSVVTMDRVKPCGVGHSKLDSASAKLGLDEHGTYVYESETQDTRMVPLKPIDAQAEVAKQGKPKVDGAHIYNNIWATAHNGPAEYVVQDQASSQPAQVPAQARAQIESQLQQTLSQIESQLQQTRAQIATQLQQAQEQAQAQLQGQLQGQLQHETEQVKAQLEQRLAELGAQLRQAQAQTPQQAQQLQAQADERAQALTQQAHQYVQSRTHELQGEVQKQLQTMSQQARQRVQDAEAQAQQQRQQARQQADAQLRQAQAQAEAQAQPGHAHAADNDQMQIG